MHLGESEMREMGPEPLMTTRMSRAYLYRAPILCGTDCASSKILSPRKDVSVT